MLRYTLLKTIIVQRKQQLLIASHYLDAPKKSTQLIAELISIIGAHFFDVKKNSYSKANKYSLEMSRCLFCIHLDK